MEFGVRVGWGVIIGVGSGVGRGVFYKLGEGVELEVGSIFMLIKMSNMKSMWRLMIVSIDILKELLVMKLLDSIRVG